VDASASRTAVGETEPDRVQEVTRCLVSWRLADSRSHEPRGRQACSPRPATKWA